MGRTLFRISKEKMDLNCGFQGGGWATYGRKELTLPVHSTRNCREAPERICRSDNENAFLSGMMEKFWKRRVVMVAKP